MTQNAMKKIEIICSQKISIEEYKKEVFLTNTELQHALRIALIGMSFTGQPIRTRSKNVKEAVCRALGYPVPKSFKKTQPRFIGQNFDTYVQKSNNLQIWNEEIDADRRYVLIKLNEYDCVTSVVVLTGSQIQILDTTGTLTSKFQARLKNPVLMNGCFIGSSDTVHLNQRLKIDGHSLLSPTANPSKKSTLPIAQLYTKIQTVVGQSFVDAGADQERNRGAELHKLVCRAIGYDNYADNGQFPDLPNQLLEVKLQTSPTVDLGLVNPASTEDISGLNIDGFGIRHCDTRYAVFYASKCVTGEIKIEGLILVTGYDFFNFFVQFKGNEVNSKLQIPLPPSLFE